MASVTSRRADSVASHRQTPRHATAVNFELQPQETPLNQQALMSLQSLQRGTHTTLSQRGSNLDSYLRKASEMLNSIAGDVNDRGAEEKERFLERQRKIREKERNGEQFDPITEEQAAQHEEFGEKVDNLTKNMYESMRRVIDDKQWRSEVPGTMKHVAERSADITNHAAEQHGEDEHPEGEESDLMRRPSAQPQIEDGPSSLLQAAQSTNQTAWHALSLHDRYAANNDYKQLYKIVWDSRHPGENQPPVPHASLWFAQDGPSASQLPQASQRVPVSQNTLGDSDTEMQEANNDDQHNDDDDDLEIFAANKRITCPLTLQPFKNPVSSNKCPHSFERAAITDLIRNSSEHVPFTDEQQAEIRRYGRAQDRKKAEEKLRRTLPKVARCPEAGCEARLGAADLYDDPALLRRTKRVLESQRRQAEQDEESDEEDTDLPRGTQRRRIVALGSSPASSRRTTFVKGERLSTVPNTQEQQLVDDVDDG